MAYRILDSKCIKTQYSDGDVEDLDRTVRETNLAHREQCLQVNNSAAAVNKQTISHCRETALLCTIWMRS